MVSVSANPDTFGKILGVGSQITSMFNYKAAEVVGENVRILMPRVIGSVHDQYMLRYFETGEAKIMGSSREVFAHKKTGHIFFCELFLTVLPVLDKVGQVHQGIHLVGMIKELAADIKHKLSELMKPKSGLYLIMYEVNSGQILEISESLQRDFGLRASLFQSQSNSSGSLNLLCPRLVDRSTQASLRSKSGELVVFDTTSLKEVNFWLGADDDDSQDKNQDSEDQQKLIVRSPQSLNELGNQPSPKQSVFHKAQCRAWISFTQAIEEREIVCVQFIELKDDTIEETDQEARNSEEIFIGGVAEKEMMSSDEESDEELSQIKNFRTVLNNNSSSKSITLIKWTILLASFLYLCLFIFIKWLTAFDEANIRQLTSLYLDLARRNWLLSDTSTSTRLFEMALK